MLKRKCLNCNRDIQISDDNPYARICDTCLQSANKGRNKYNAEKKVVDGIRFDSMAEAQMYTYLKTLEKAGKVRDLTLQPKFILIPGFTSASGRKIRPLIYTADFKFFDIEKDRERILDCKGFRTQVYEIKKKFFNYLHKDDGFWLEETI